MAHALSSPRHDEVGLWAQRWGMSSEQTPWEKPGDVVESPDRASDSEPIDQLDVTDFERQRTK